MSRPALGNTRTYTYDADGRLTSATDALGNETTYAYDALGRVTTVTNAKGVSTTYTYDANGNLLTATDAAGTVSYAYDALGRCVSVTDRKGNPQSFTYDAKGQITKVTDKNGNETAYTYDPNGNITKTTDALGTEVLFQYNANGQLIKMTQNRVDAYHEQAETLVTLYQYDGRNLVTKVVRGENEELYTYDGNGNMLTKTDGDGYVTEYSYNSLDLVSHINYNDAKEVSYQYNKVGELVKMDDWLGTTAFEVDLLGQLKKVTDHKGNVVSYEYDAVGNQTSITYPDETAVTKTYDNTYNLTKVTDAEQKNYLYEYDDAGRVTKLTYPNGWVEEYTYDNEGNLLKTVDTDPFHNNKKSTKFEYRYDAEGNLVSEYKRDTTASNRALTTTYAYDALNRLTSAHEEGVGINTTRTYQYDTLGNLIRQEQDGCIEYKYNGYSLDETTKCGTIPNSIGTSYWEYTYDGRGNLVSNDKYTRTTSGMAWQNEETYVYDETNRLVQGKNEDGEYSLYTYNGLGVRVGRELILKDNTHGYTDFHSQTPSVETGLTKPEVVKESYVIDYTSATYNTLVMDEEGGFNYRWVYGLDRLSVKITSEGTNWWGQHVTTDILKDYTHQDRLGSTVNLSDQFGRVVGRADYNEWGEVTYKEALSITSSYRRIWPQLNYTGYDWDDVLGMYYAKARFYSADDKRFVAIDPIKGQITDPLSLVSYLYCVDNPLRYVDPLGMLAMNRGLDQVAFDGGNSNALLGTDLIAASKYVLKRGRKGDAVFALQQFLAQAGYYPAEELDGSFGKKTDAAVRAFQAANGLDVDGSVGPKTWAKILLSTPTNREENLDPSKTEIPKSPVVPCTDEINYTMLPGQTDHRDDIITLQQRLYALQFLRTENGAREIDGRFGANGKTAAAVKAFQDAYLPEIANDATRYGQVDSATWNALREAWYKKFSCIGEEFVAPVNILDAGVVTATFNTYDEVHTDHLHRGTDIAIQSGTPVFAIRSGIVLNTGFDKDGRGHWLYIDHSFKVRAVYQHLNAKPIVSKGDVVARGQIVGYVGNSGHSTGPHLHIELLIGIPDDQYRAFPPGRADMSYHVDAAEYLPLGRTTGG